MIFSTYNLNCLNLFFLMTIRLLLNLLLISFLQKTNTTIFNHIQIIYSLTQSLTLLHIPLHNPTHSLHTLHLNHPFPYITSQPSIFNTWELFEFQMRLHLIQAIQFKLKPSQPSILFLPPPPHDLEYSTSIFFLPLHSITCV
jgi:hypothetical protein